MENSFWKTRSRTRWHGCTYVPPPSDHRHIEVSKTAQFHVFSFSYIHIFPLFFISFLPSLLSPIHHSLALALFSPLSLPPLSSSSPSPPSSPPPYSASELGFDSSLSDITYAKAICVLFETDDIDSNKGFKSKLIEREGSTIKWATLNYIYTS